MRLKFQGLRPKGIEATGDVAYRKDLRGNVAT